MDVLVKRHKECDLRNTPSWKLLDKVGLNREAHFKQNIYFHKESDGNPVWKDTYVYAITEDEYENRKMSGTFDGIL